MEVPDDKSLEALQLPCRLQNALEEHGIFTVGDLLHCSLMDLRTVTRIPRGKASHESWGARQSDHRFRGPFER